MSEFKHTPEPWRISHQGKTTRIFGPNPEQLILTMSKKTPNSDSDSMRIFECVNAMQGVIHPLEWRKFEVTKIEEIARLEKINNEAFSILETIKNSMLRTGINYDNAELYNKINNFLTNKSK